MRLLAVESAFEACSVALWQEGAVVERFHAGPRGHAEHLLPFVETLLAEAELGLSALDGVAFSRGPGSFTSLRIGIGVVQGLAFGADLPVWPVSSLRVTAQAAATHGVQQALVAVDARMNEVFSGAFVLRDGLMQAVSDERVGPAVDVLATRIARSAGLGRDAGWAGVGNGFERFAALAAVDTEAAFRGEDRTHAAEAQSPEIVRKAALSTELRIASRYPALVPRASLLALLAAAEWDPEKACSAPEAQPVYLRDRVAEKPGAGPGS